jgi:hypothetical protein
MLALQDMRLYCALRERDMGSQKSSAIEAGITDQALLAKVKKYRR